jgi:hypothetical protein
MPVRKDKNSDYCTPTSLALRFPTRTTAELVITDNGVTTVHNLTLNQIKLLAYKSVEALTAWPARED